MPNDSYNPYSSPYQMPPADLDGVMQDLAGALDPAVPPQNQSDYEVNSFSEVLRRSLGYFAVCEFLIGTGGLVEKYGILVVAGDNFVTLYDPDTGRYTTCDLYSLKFVTTYNSRVRPPNFMPRTPQPGFVPRNLR